jgi:hypothetical protein
MLVPWVELETAGAEKLPHLALDDRLVPGHGIELAVEIDAVGVRPGRNLPKGVVEALIAVRFHVGSDRNGHVLHGQRVSSVRAVVLVDAESHRLPPRSNADSLRDLFLPRRKSSEKRSRRGKKCEGTAAQNYTLGTVCQSSHAAKNITLDVTTGVPGRI